MPLGKTHSKCILSCQYHTYIIKPKKNVIENELNWQCSKNQLHRNYQQIEAIHNLVVRRLPSSRSSASIVIACAGHILWNEANLWEIWAEQGLKSKDNSKLSWTFVLNLEMLRQNPLSLAWRCWCLDQIDHFWVGNRNKLKIKNNNKKKGAERGMSVHFQAGLCFIKGGEVSRVNDQDHNRGRISFS